MRFEIRKHRMQFKHELGIYDGISVHDTELGELIGEFNNLREALQTLCSLESNIWKEETYTGYVWILEEYAIHQVDEDGEPVEDELNYYSSTLPIE